MGRRHANETKSIPNVDNAELSTVRLIPTDISKERRRDAVTSHHECPPETLESRLLVSNIIRINPSRNRGHKERLNDSAVGVGDLKLETEAIKRYLTYFEPALHRNAAIVWGVRSFSAGDARRMLLISLSVQGHDSLPLIVDLVDQFKPTRSKCKNRHACATKSIQFRIPEEGIESHTTKILKCTVHNAASDSVNSLQI